LAASDYFCCVFVVAKLSTLNLFSFYYIFVEIKKLFYKKIQGGDLKWKKKISLIVSCVFLQKSCMKNPKENNHNIIFFSFYYTNLDIYYFFCVFFVCLKYNPESSVKHSGLVLAVSKKGGVKW